MLGMKKWIHIVTLFIAVIGIASSLNAQDKKQSSYTLGGLLFGDLYHVQKHHLEEGDVNFFT